MGDQDDRKSTSGDLFMLGASPISLSSNKQGIAALSSCEIVYVAASYGVNQTLRFEMLLEELNVSNIVKIKLLVDNQ